MQRYTIYPTSPNKLRRNIYKKDKYPKTQAVDYLSLNYPTIALPSLLLRFSSVTPLLFRLYYNYRMMGLTSELQRSYYGPALLGESAYFNAFRNSY